MTQGRRESLSTGWGNRERHEMCLAHNARAAACWDGLSHPTARGRHSLASVMETATGLLIWVVLFNVPQLLYKLSRSGDTFFGELRKLRLLKD